MPIANDVSGYKWHNSLFRYAQASPGSGVGEVGFIRARMACTPYQPNARHKSIRCRVEAIQQLNGAATAEAPRVSGEEPPFMISNGDPAVIPAGFVNILDELGAELSLHERVAGDLADPASAFTALGQGEELCHEWHGHRVGALADVGVFGAVDLVEGLVLDGDIGRVADDDVVAPFLQQGQQEGAVLSGVGERHEGAAVAHAGEHARVGAVDEGVANGQVEGECRGGLQRGEAGCREGGEGEAEAGYGDRKGIEVNAVDRVEGGLDAGLEFQAGGVAVPAVEQAVEGAEQEVA